MVNQINQNPTKQLEEQLKKLELQLSRIKPEKVIRNTPEAIRRMEAIRRANPYRGREIAMNQQEVSYG